MSGPTLAELRAHVEALASDGGSYGVVCARTGDAPVPTAGLRFESRGEARRAARATALYRARLRRFDPRLPVYDTIVRDFDPVGAPTGAAGERPAGRLDTPEGRPRGSR